MESNTKYKIMVLVIVILSVTTVGLGIYVVYNQFIVDNKCNAPTENKTKEENKEKEDNKVYETMSEDEIKEALAEDDGAYYFSKPVYYLTRQGNLIFDVEKFLNERKDDILEKILFGLFYNSSSSFVTKDEIMKKTRELYGYDLDYNFTDIGSEDYIDFKWDSKTQSYILTSWEVLAGHGRCDYGVTMEIIDIKKLDDNSYDVTTAQLWTGEECEGDMTTALYDYYQNAKSESNPLVTIDGESSDYDKLFDSAFKKAKKEVEKGNYRYRLVKENGIVKITQYVSINQY